LTQQPDTSTINRAASMIFDIDLMDTPSFLEGSSVDLIPFVRRTASRRNALPMDQDPMLRVGLITESGL
jgi:hypothetical protein